jgi:UDP-N-acetylglucosamine diphosphorylase / glucose-1-phosphate thymidylyltransferase / UDP-N-acetylgalactosamine diphosphorylase / glucosamine-1-phosphate N-acetyltransferase / galactosamine-1-phosphate N-acetyltransferase
VQSFKNILLYEDTIARSRKFLPLTYTRSVAELRSGAFTGIERIQAQFPDASIHLHARPELKDVIAGRYAFPVNEVPVGKALLVNARETLQFSPNDCGNVYDVLPSDLSQQLIAGEPIESQSNDAPQALWDIIHSNSATLQADAELWTKNHKRIENPSFPNCAIIHPENLFVFPGARIDSGVVLDCSEGAIVIEEGVRIMPQATIIGPAFIGKHSTVKIGAKIYGGTSIGPVSKIGGEIENSIIQSYSNKQHDGYLGHSFIGQWVNLGAGTNTSDLKNDYSPVHVTIEGEEFNTNSLFVGLLMGDHSKSAIGTQFNTGTSVGVSCNIFGEGFPPKWIPNFSWVGENSIESYRYDKAIEVAKIVMGRRNQELPVESEAMLKSLLNKRNL